MTLDNLVTESRRARSTASPTVPSAAVHGDFRKLTRKNTDFRREIATTDHAQLTLMCIGPGEEIGEETHDVDQLLVLVRGHGELRLRGKATAVPKGSLVVIAAGTRHNVLNTGDKPLQLFSVYAPPHHARGTRHRTRADAVAAEEREAQRQVAARSRRPGAKLLRGTKAGERNRKT